jgi:hypothetical protein
MNSINEEDREMYQVVNNSSSDISIDTQKIVKYMEIEETQRIDSEEEQGDNDKISKYGSIFLYFIRDHFPFLIGILFYFKSLEGCKENDIQCKENFNDDKLKALLAHIFYSSVLFAFNFFLCLIGILPMKRIISCIAILLFLNYIYDSGKTIESHGYYNSMFLNYFIIFLLILTSPFVIFFRLLFWERLRKWKYHTAFFFCFFLILIYMIFHMLFSYSCSEWDKGFKGTSINNNLKCKVTKPSICYETLLDGVFDISKYMGKKCENSIGSREIIENYTSLKNFTKIGYPRTEKWSFVPKSVYENRVYHKNVLKEIIDMKDYIKPSNTSDEIEVTTEFNPNFKYPKVEINLKKQQHLIESRRNLSQRKNNTLIQNIFILFVDSVSRNHFKRKLPKVYKWIEQFYIKNNTKDDKDSNNYLYESFQYMKFNGAGGWTNANLLPLFQGKRWDDFSGKSVIKDFKESGYITGTVENYCAREFIDLYGGMSNSQWEPYDHDFTSFFCDPNNEPPSQFLHYLTGTYGVLKKCMYGKHTLEYATEYAMQFLKTYRSEKKFFRLGTINGHEATGEVIQYDDDIFYNFLMEFEKQGFMNDTIVMILSDHGYTLPGFHYYWGSPDHEKETLLPMLSLILPKNMKNYNEIRRVLKINEDHFVSMYDLHTTFYKILNMTDPADSKGDSLLTQSFENRENNCKRIGIRNDWCRCSDEI